MSSHTALRIGVATLYDESFREVGDISCRNKFAYCERHGYSFHVLRHLVADPPASYSKLPFLLRLLPLHDWLLWIDADALVMNYRRRIEEFLDERRSLIAGEDWNGIQSGVLFIQHSPWSLSLLERAIAVPRESLKRFTDQEQLARAIAEDPEAARETSRRLLKQSGGDADFNAYTREDPTFPADPRFRYFEPGDFILHFAGMGDRDLLRRLVKLHAARVVV